MSTENPRIDEPGTLPDAPDATQVDRMERGILRDVELDRMRRRARRSRGWATAAAAVAVVALAALVSPAVVSGVGGGSSASSVAEPARLDAAPGSGGESEVQQLDVATDAMGTSGGDSMAGREVAASASVTVTVDDTTTAQRAITEIAQGVDGYVSSVSVSDSGAVIDPAITYPLPSQSWITLRVPADQLSGVIDQVGELGEVSSSTVDRFDVTDQAVDLRARISAQETSVARLSELLAQSASVTDLIAAESALADRQAALDADRQQLAMVEDQVAMSTLTVTLTAQDAPPAADPAGFGDGIAAGWNGLVATLNGIVLGLGFLLPWFGVLAVIAVIVWGVRRLVRARRVRRAASGGSTPPVAGDEHTDET